MNQINTKSVIAEKFIHIKYINNYISYKNNNKCHITIKMKPVDIKLSTYIDSSKEINDKDPKFKAGHIVRISKSKNIFAKGYVRNWSDKIFLIKNCAVVISDLKGEGIAGNFLQKRIAKNKENLDLKKWKKKKIEKAINYMLNIKATRVLLTVWLIKMA